MRSVVKQCLLWRIRKDLPMSPTTDDLDFFMIILMHEGWILGVFIYYISYFSYTKGLFLYNKCSKCPPLAFMLALHLFTKDLFMQRGPWHGRILLLKFVLQLCQFFPAAAWYLVSASHRLNLLSRPNKIIPGDKDLAGHSIRPRHPFDRLFTCFSWVFLQVFPLL